MNWKMTLLMAAALVLAAGTFARVGVGQDAAPAPNSTPTSTPAAVGELPEESAPAALADRMGEIWKNLKIKWELGGPTMYALAFVALVAAVFILDRIFGLRRGRIVPRGLADKANRLWQAGKHGEILAMTRRDSSALGEIIGFIVAHRNNPYENITSGAEDIAARHFELQERRNYALAAAGTLAPLLGLMGTIFGLMGAFASIGVYGSMDDPSVLAGDIGEAMITTATGLIIAVPALGLYHYFTSRTSQYASLLGQEVNSLMHGWFLKKEGDDNESAA